MSPKQIHPSCLAVHAATAVAFLVATLAQGQESQFLFDATGNLLVQTAEASPPPQILGQPQDQIVAPGDAASFSVVVADARALTYQWRFNGANIGGANNDALLLQNVGTNNAGQYSVVLVNGSGSVTSAPAALMLDSRGSGMPDSWQLAYFGNLTNTATGDFDGDGVSNLQEFLDGTDPTDPASVRYRLVVASDGGSVTVVPNQLSYTNGQTVTLTASPPESFHAWTGDLTTHSNSITLTMTTNRLVLAHFLPMDFTWTNPAGGDWTVATNWDPNLVPGPNDNVYILISAPVTLNTNADCGALTLGGPSAFPSLNGNGVLTVHRPSVWSSGGLNGSGRLVIAPEGLLSLANGGLIFLNGWALENGGTIQWGGTGDLGLASSAVITNRPGALFDAQIAASIGYLSGAACRFDNAGTFRKSLATGTNTFSGVVAFNNYGSVEVQTGTLLWSGNLVNNGTVTLSAGTTNRLAGGGSGSGTFTAPATALVEFSGGTFSLDPGAQLNGAGLYKVSSDANLTANTDVPLQNLDLGSTLNGSGLVTVNNVLNWTGGGMDGSGRTLIAPGAALNVNSTTGVRLNRTLENAGTTLCAGSGGFNGGAAAAIITNRPGALFEVRNNGSFTQGAAVCRFDNAGTFRKSLSTGTNTFDGAFNFNNYGVVELQSGTLLCIGGFLNNGAITLSAGTTNRLGGSGSGTGTYTAPATALVEISGAFTLNPGAQLNGAGLYKVSGGSLVANTNVWLQNLDLAGILGGTGLVTVSNVLNWTAGTMDTSGRTLIAPGAALNVNSPTGVALNRTLENAGTTLCTDSGGFSGGLAAAIITNRPGALFEVRNNASFTHGLANCRFDNAGTFRKSLATGTNTFSGAFGFNNYGTVDLRSGILGATGGYTSTTNAMLNCALGGTSPGTGYAQLQVAGTVTLNGALSVGLMNGYLPTTNDSFTVLSAGTRSGTFANFSYPSNQVTMQLSNTTSSVIVRVTGVTAPPPAPLLLTPLLSGTNVLLTWTAVSNILYRLEFNPDLAPSNWTTVPGDVLSSGVNASKLDPLTSSNRFYRVRVLP